MAVTPQADADVQALRAWTWLVWDLHFGRDPLPAAASHLDPEDTNPTIRQAFQQVNGADSRASAAVRDGIVDFNGGQRRIVPDSPS